MIVMISGQNRRKTVTQSYGSKVSNTMIAKLPEKSHGYNPSLNCSLEKGFYIWVISRAVSKNTRGGDGLQIQLLTVEINLS